MSIERLIDLLCHADVNWRRQGRELLRALGVDASAQIFDRLSHGTWLHPLNAGDASELVAGLAESAGLGERRAGIRELPPMTTTDARDIETIVEGFPNATLRLVWERPPESVDFMAELRAESIQLSLEKWTLGPLRLSESLRRLMIFGAVPEFEAPGLRELEVSSWSSSWFETTFDRLAPQLERVHVLNQSGDLPAALPKVRDLRVPFLPMRLRVERPLERVHVGLASGRRVLDHPAVGSETRVRIDDWEQPESSIAGDLRPVWVGARHEGWQPLLSTLPNLEVAEVDVLEYLPPDVLPIPWMLAHSFDRESASYRAALQAWARRGRGWALRRAARTYGKITWMKRVRAFSAWGLRHAKAFVEAIDDNRLVALSLAEALYWQSVLGDKMDLSVMQQGETHTAIE